MRTFTKIKLCLPRGVLGGIIRISASISRATSFHLGCGEAVEELVNLILIGFVSSTSEKMFEDWGERTGGLGDFGSCIGGVVGKRLTSFPADVTMFVYQRKPFRLK